MCHYPSLQLRTSIVQSKQIPFRCLNVTAVFLPQLQEDCALVMVPYDDPSVIRGGGQQSAIR